MNAPDKESNPNHNTETPKCEESACSPGCCCHGPRSANCVRWMVGAIVIVAAGVLVARAVLKNKSAPAVDVAPTRLAPRQADGPSSSSAANPAPSEASAAVAVKEIQTLSDLNAIAADTVGAFVFLPGKNDPPMKAPFAQMRAAAKTIEAQGQKIGVFRLKTDSPDYAQIAGQMTVPVVLAMVKGRGTIPVAGDITETKLVQGFVAASSSGGCGPSGCGPSGCN
jgi:hypothetical protein